jgi:hypothetical protein
MLAVLGALAALASLALAAVCCQQALSIQGDVSVPTTTSACGIQMPVGACASCVAASCCDQSQACAGDHACMGLESCLLACGSDYACRATCVETHPSGSSIAVPTLDTCVARSCGAACGLECGIPGSYTSPDLAQDCQDCIAASGSCNAAAECTADLTCELGAHCAYACPTPDCRNACSVGVDAGTAALFQDAALNVGTSCIVRCGWGKNWSCAGKLSPPPAQAANQPQDVTLTLTGLPPGAVVTATPCGTQTVPCGESIASASTDSAGMVTITGLPPATLYGFGGYFELRSPAIVDSSYWLSFPLSAQHAQIAMPMTTPDALGGFMKQVNVTPVPGRGHVLIAVEDCLQLPASGVVVTPQAPLDDQSLEVYFDAFVLSRTATSTSATGFVYFFNMPIGSTTFEIVPPGAKAPVAHLSVVVEDGVLAMATALPVSQ